MLRATSQKTFVQGFRRGGVRLQLLILVTRTLAGWFLAIKLSCSPIFMLIALVLVVVCAGPSVCKLPIADLRRFPRLLDFLVASARSFHSFYSASRFSYPASLAVGRRVVVTAASRPNVTSIHIAVQACPSWSGNEARGDRGVWSAIGRCVRLASRRAIRPAVFACCRSQFAGVNSHGSNAHVCT